MDHASRAAAAMRAGDHAGAAAALEAALAARPGDAELWLGLALARRGAGGDVLGPLDRALALRPGDARALILKGDALAALGRAREAARVYAGAVRAAGPAERLPPALAREVARAGAGRADYARAYEAHVAASVDAEAGGPRFAEALDVMFGRARVFHQEPKLFLMPGLAARAFHPRADFPWLPALEAAAPAIRAELEPFTGGAAFAPYVEPDAIRPGADDGGMRGNADWSALYLVRDGAPTAHARHFPATMAAVERAPLSRVPGRTPAVLFSRLTPGARIPPHTGFVNTRLICHLGVVARPGAWLRVGNHRREWREGEAFVFDDTIEHEAVNDSGADRTVLLFDVWRPDLDAAERAAVTRLFAAIDGFGAGERWDG